MLERKAISISSVKNRRNAVVAVLLLIMVTASYFGLTYRVSSFSTISGIWPDEVNAALAVGESDEMMKVEEGLEPLLDHLAQYRYRRISSAESDQEPGEETAAFTFYLESESREVLVQPMEQWIRIDSDLYEVVDGELDASVFKKVFE